MAIRHVLAVLLLLPLLIGSATAVSRELRIGFPNADLLTAASLGKLNTRLQGVNKGVTLRMTTTDFPKLSANCSNIECMNTFETELKKRNYHAIIARCSEQLMSVSKSIDLPYFLVKDDADCETWLGWPNNTFRFGFDETLKAQAVKSMFKALRITKVMAFIDYLGYHHKYYTELSHLFHSVATLQPEFSEDDYRDVLLNTTRSFHTDRNFAFVVIVENKTMIKTILEQGLLTGYVSTRKRWFLPTFVGNISELSDFVASDASIFTYKVMNDPRKYDGILTPLESAEASVQFIIDVYGKSVDSKTPPLPILKKGRTTTLIGATAFSETTGELLNIPVHISRIQARQSVDLKYIYENGYTRLANSKLGDPTDWKVAFLPNSVFFSKGATLSQYSGFALDLLSALAKNNDDLFFNFIFPKDENFTEDNAGMIRLLVEKKADVALVAVPVRSSDMELVSFVDPSFGEQGINMMMVKQNETWFDRMIWYFTVPFTLNVWIGLAICFVLLSFVLWATDKISPNYSGEKIFGIIDALFLIAAAFMMAKLDVFPRMMSVRIFNILLWFSTLIVVASYAASLFPFILNKPPYRPVTSFQDAYDGGTYRWFWSLKSFDDFLALAQRYPEDIYQKMIDKANASWPDQMFIERMNDTNDISSFLKDHTNFISIGNSLDHQVLTIRNCEFEIVGTTQVIKTTAFPFRKDWNGIKLFTELYTDIVENTEFQKLKDSYFFFNPCNTNSGGKTIQAMDVYDVMGIFLLLGSGIVLAIIIGLFELTIHKCDLSCQRCRSSGLDFGKIYKCKVETIAPDGVWVRVRRQKEDRSYFVSNANLSPGRDHPVSAVDLGLQTGSKLSLRYNGNDPGTGERIFKICMK